MTDKPLIVDLHCHPNLKSFNSGHPNPSKDMWEKIYHRTDHHRFAKRLSDQSPHVLKESQCNLYGMGEAGLRVFNISLYPIERGFINLRNVPNWLIGNKKQEMMQEVITGFEIDRIRYLKKHVDYYEELNAEYAYVRDTTGVSPDRKWEFRIANNYKELTSNLKKDNVLSAIMSIEGAHVFGTGTEASEAMDETDLSILLIERIKAVKNWEYPPFTINLAHHFWNQLSGHATSFKLPVSAMVNQNKGKDRGITPLGWIAIREMLSLRNGKRILIDAKHMSALARIQYYHFIEHYNYINPHDRIPIIYSHAAMNGFNTIDSSIKEPDNAAKTRHHRLYKWSINVSNEEARIIHRSGGLIGLMMDKGNLGGLKTVRDITAIEDIQQQKDEFCKLFWENAFQIVKAIGDASGWDTVALGTDYDGTITHIDPYESALKLPEFAADLTAYLEKTGYKEELWYHLTPAKLVRKIFSENAMRFYEEFFV